MSEDARTCALRPGRLNLVLGQYSSTDCAPGPTGELRPYSRRRRVSKSPSVGQGKGWVQTTKIIVNEMTFLIFDMQNENCGPVGREHLPFS